VTRVEYIPRTGTQHRAKRRSIDQRFDVRTCVEVGGLSMSVVVSGAHVTIKRLVINGGGSTTGSGGGLENFGTLTLDNTTVTKNTATTSSGSAIGGGIYNDGTLTLNGSIVSSNTAASSSGGEGHGGGIYNDTGGSITLNNSKITGNTAVAARPTGSAAASTLAGAP
jgi:hypothetical protein